MRRFIAMITVMVLVMAGCSDAADDAVSVEEPIATTQAVPEPSTATESIAPAMEAVDAKVVFDGKVCSYLGPSVIPAGTEVTFEFDDAAHPAALVVLLVEEGTTWDQVLETAGPGMAQRVPPWVVSFWVQIESGSLVRTLPQGDYLITCNTAPDDTDAVHPAALIEVIEG